MKRAKGFIQLACTFHSIPDNLVQYPKPVLTVCGELDGQITLSGIVKHAGEVYSMKEELGDYFVNAIKPVIIVPGMNHAQFSHCIPKREREDLDDLIPNEKAKRLIKELLSSFITLHGSNEPNHEVLSVLTDGVRQTAERHGTFWAAIKDQSRGVKQMQLELASLEEDLHIGIVSHEYKQSYFHGSRGRKWLRGCAMDNLNKSCPRYAREVCRYALFEAPNRCKGHGMDIHGLL